MVDLRLQQAQYGSIRPFDAVEGGRHMHGFPLLIAQAVKDDITWQPGHVAPGWPKGRIGYAGEEILVAAFRILAWA